jgi:lipoyl(octanoyl) transferase
MTAFTARRGAETPDEIWFLHHPSIYTLGVNANRKHVLIPSDIPIIQADRGGQVTYHGPGQLIAYTLLDLRRAKLGIRDLVSALETAMIATVANYGIKAIRHKDAPGIYVDGAKLGSIGLRIRRGCSYHGLALNVDMDLVPFGQIDPCGYANLPVTQLADLAGPVNMDHVIDLLTASLTKYVRSTPA